MREEKKITFHKSGPSNLLAGRTESMFKLIIFVLFFVVKDKFPNVYVCVGEELVPSQILVIHLIPIGLWQL